MEGTLNSENVNQMITFVFFLKDLSMDQNQLEIKKAQARITELEAKLLNRQETIDRLELEVKGLQDQLMQCPGSVPCQQVCLRTVWLAWRMCQPPV